MIGVKNTVENNFTVMKTILKTIATGQTLNEQEAERAFNLLTSGEATPVQIAAFLIGIHMRGETREEIIGAVRSLRAQSVSISAPNHAIDTCGTGGDHSGTYNISTAVSFVVAACGVPVAKHGNRAISSQSGAADVLSALGVNIECDLSLVQSSLWDIGVCFLMAPRHHPAMRHVGSVRKELGTPTIFNLLGPLLNPAGVKRQLIGIFEKKWMDTLIQVLRNLGSEVVWLVHGSDGLDEITTTGITYVTQLRNKNITSFEINPQQYRIPQVPLNVLTGKSAADNALALRKVLQGQKSPYRDIVILNSAAALLIADKVSDLQQGIQRATQAIDSLKALKLLERLIAFTNRSVNHE